MKKIIILINLIILTSILGAVDLIDPPTKAEAKAYFNKWKDGHNGNRGYIQDFYLPEDVWLLKQGSTWSTMKEDHPNDGNRKGAVVFMGGNGTDDEFPKGAGVCVSTDEAMGYGMMLAVMADDKELFDKLARVVIYYQTEEDKNVPTDKLTSWVIPAVNDGTYPEYDELLKKVTDRENDGWTYKYVDGASNPAKIIKCPYKPKYVDENGDINDDPSKNTHIKGDILNITPGSNDRTVGGIAIDGALDIAFAFAMAHTKWIGPGDPDEGDLDYLEIAIERYSQIYGVIKTYGKNGEYLPLGNYYNFDADENKRDITRPSDWLVTHFRTSFEFNGDKQAIDIAGKLQGFMDDFDNYNTTASIIHTKTVPDQPLKTGFLSDFAEVDVKNKKLKLLKNTPKVIHEDDPTNFYMNVSRFPIRQAMDYLLYGDEYSILRSVDVVKLPYKMYEANKKYFKNISGNANKPYDCSYEKWDKDGNYTHYGYGNPLATNRSLDGKIVAEYSSRVLLCSLLTTIYAADKYGVKDYNAMYNDFMGSNNSETKLNLFESRDKKHWKNVYEGGFTRTKVGEENIKDADLDLSFDPFTVTGYYEDTWAALTLFALADGWIRPQTHENEFKDTGIRWNTEPNSDQYLDLDTTNISDDSMTVTFKKDLPQNEEAVIIVDNFKALTSGNYIFMTTIGKEGGYDAATQINAQIIFPESNNKSSKMLREFSFEDNLNRVNMGYINHIDKPNSKVEDCKFRIIFKGKDRGIKQGTKYTFTDLGLYDPPEEVNRYRYVDNWRSDAEYFIVGDYVRYEQETWQCIKDHDIVNTSTGEIIKPSINSEYWELSDYNLTGTRWETGTFYKDGDLVNYKGKTYIAKTSFTSIYSPFDSPSNWMLYYDPSAGYSIDWFASGAFSVGDIVQYNGSYYECTLQHNANTAWTPVAASNLWNNVNGKFIPSNPSPWETQTWYEAGAIVKYNERTYKCVSRHKSQPDWSPDKPTYLWK